MYEEWKGMTEICTSGIHALMLRKCITVWLLSDRPSLPARPPCLTLSLLRAMPMAGCPKYICNAAVT